MKATAYTWEVFYVTNIRNAAKTNNVIFCNKYLTYFNISHTMKIRRAEARHIAIFSDGKKETGRNLQAETDQTPENRINKPKPVYGSMHETEVLRRD